MVRNIKQDFLYYKIWSISIMQSLSIGKSQWREIWRDVLKRLQCFLCMETSWKMEN